MNAAATSPRPQTRSDTEMTAVWPQEVGWDNGRVCLNSPYSAYRLSIIKASSASSSIRTDCLCQMEYAQQDTPLIRRSIRRSHTPQDNAARQQRHGQRPASRLLIHLARLPFSDGRLKNAPSLLAYGEPDDRPSATCAPPEVHALRSTTLEVTWHFVRLNVAAHYVRLRSSATQRLDCLVPRYEPLGFYPGVLKPVASALQIVAANSARECRSQHFFTTISPTLQDPRALLCCSSCRGRTSSLAQPATRDNHFKAPFRSPLRS
jgi:hypothetical protein